MTEIPPKVNLRNQGPKLYSFDFHALELEMKARLPEDYCEFLLTNNGGIPDPRVGFSWKDGVRGVGAFFRLLPTPDHGLRQALRAMREANIEGFLPIAGSRADDICLSFHDNSGTVTVTEYIYREDFVVGTKMHPLANSFSEFLNTLVEIDVPYCRIEDLGQRGTPDDLMKYLTEGNSLDAQGKNNRTILCEAILFTNLPVVEACLERKANLSKAVVNAVRSRRPELIRRVVNAGADVNERDEYGRTPIRDVGGTLLPGDEGARNRKLREVLIELGAHE